MTRKIWALALLLIFPSIFLFVGSNFNSAKYAGDPSYIYLMNAINLARGKDAGHVDNPGTPVMEIGTGVIYIHHLINGSDEKTLQEEVLHDPDKYVGLIRVFFILLITLFLIFAGWFYYAKTDNIWMAFVIQFTPFLSINVLERSWTTVAPEPVLLFITTMYVVLLGWFYFDEKKSPVTYLILFAVFGGLGLATKTTFLPVLVIPFFLFKGWKNKLFYFLGTIAAFFLFTFPAHKEYKNMFRWYDRLIGHTGVYGSGDKGLIDVSAYFKAIPEILVNNPYFTVFLVLAVAIIIWVLVKRIQTKSTLAFKILSALVVANLLAVLIVAKHYFNNHYLLPVLSLSGLMFFFLVEVISGVFKLQKIKSYLSAGFLIIALVIFVFHSIPILQVKDKGYYDTNAELKKVETFMDCNYPGYLRIYHYPDGLNKISALKFGNGYSKILNRFALDDLYPEAYFFNVMFGHFQHWETAYPTVDLVKEYGTKMIITGRPLSPAGMQMLNEQGFYVDSVYIGKFQSVYAIDSLSAQLSQYSSR